MQQFFCFLTSDLWPVQVSWRWCWTGGCSRTITAASVRASPTTSWQRVCTTCCWRTGRAGHRWGGQGSGERVGVRVRDYLFFFIVYILFCLFFVFSWQEVGGASVEHLSLLAHLTSLSLCHSPITMVAPSDSQLPKLRPFLPLRSSLPCDVHLLNLRTLEDTQVTPGTTVHKNNT